MQFFLYLRNENALENFIANHSEEWWDTSMGLIPINRKIDNTKPQPASAYLFIFQELQAASLFWCMRKKEFELRKKSALWQAEK